MSSSIEHKGGQSRKSQTRAQEYIDARVDVPQVKVDAGYFFLEMLMEVGPVKSSPMGGVLAIDWPDIHAYCYGLPTDVEHWERLLLLEMSRVYASGISEGTNAFSIAPVDRDTNETAP